MISIGSYATCVGQGESNGILREVFNDVPGSLVSDLRADASFPDNPDLQEIYTQGFDLPVDIDENYGTRVRGYVVPSTSGSYVFEIAGDDNCELYLSSNESPTNVRLIANVPGWTSHQQWGKYPEQSSSPVTLQSGRRYYIEALMKEQGGGDSLTVRWRLPNGTFETPIPHRSLEPYIPEPPAITSQPKTVTVTEGNFAEFSISVSRASLTSIQWRRNDEDIPNANQETLVFGPVKSQDNGNRFQARVTIPGGQVLESTTATLNVAADSTPPAFLGAENLGDPQSVTLRFSETIDKASAENLAHYSVSEGIDVLDVRLLEDGRTVFLQVSPLKAGFTYSISVSGIRDTSSLANQMEPTSRRFAYDYVPITRAELALPFEPIGPSSRISGLVISEFSYNPLPGDNGENLEFIEIFNSEEWDLELSRHRITGEADYVFEAGTIIPARGYLVVAADPDALRSEYSITNVVGPWTGNLGNGGGRIRLRDPIGGLLQEISYTDQSPWPSATDGAGHSLVLVRPSYGENNPIAWAPSNTAGGNPGKADTFTPHPHSNVVINEIYANSPEPFPDFIELFNLSNSAISLDGCHLTDDPQAFKYTFPANTILPAKGYIVVDENVLGFNLSSAGESLFLFNPEKNRVIDAFRFGGQPENVSYGRYPDGSDYWTQLQNPTPEDPNKSPRIGSIVIHEIMYNPISGSNNHEYIELYNRSSQPVDMSGWKIRGDVSYTFPPDSIVPGHGYVIAANNSDELKTIYPDLSDANTFGNFSGSLSNSRGHIRLLRPEPQSGGSPIDVLEDEIEFIDGGLWANEADGEGSSLELIHPDLDNNKHANWAPSRESDKSEWKSYSWTGRLDNGRGTPNELQIILLGAGECLIDDIQVTQGNNVNRVANGTFETNLSGWVIQGNHMASELSGVGTGYQSSRALHLITSSGGDNGANRVECDLTQNLTVNQNATITAQIKWLKGQPDILFRTYGNFGELAARMDVPLNLGSPGIENSVGAANAPPSIENVTHNPIVPRAGQEVRILARVTDDNQLSKVFLNYRIHPSTNSIVVPMEYRGAGYFTAGIPGQSAGRTVGFRIEAADAHSGSLTSSFPSSNLLHEGIIRFGDSTPTGTFGVYRIWIGPENVQEWRTRAKLSNELIPVTFVYGNHRAIYSASGRYRGSPFIRPGFGSPQDSGATAMIYRFPSDQPFLGTDKVNLDGLEPGRDDTSQREKTSFWIGEQLGVPYSYQRYIRLLVNGTLKSDVFTDSMQPDSEYIERWYPSETEGDLFKIDDWFEFSDGNDPRMSFNQNARLTSYTTTGGQLKPTAYRWMWEKRPNGGFENDYSKLMELVQALNSSASAYTGAVDQIVDVDQWMRVFATRHIVGDWDGYGYNRGKNQSAYKPVDGKWKMLLWDLDFSLGGGSDGPTTSMYNCDDPTISRMYQHPPFQRAYLRAWQDAVDGPLNLPAIRQQTSKVHGSFVRNGINAANPGAIVSWVTSRRNYLVSELNSYSTVLTVTSNSGADFSSTSNFVALQGTAPVKIKTLLFNGIPMPVEWSASDRWRTSIPLVSGANPIVITGLDSYGNPIPDLSDTVTITYTVTSGNPADFITINEIHYNPLEPDLGFVELHNRSTTQAFILDGFRFDGLGYTFPAGSTIQPGGFLVLASNPGVLSSKMPQGITVFAQFPGNLSNRGEVLTLIQSDPISGSDIIIDQVEYSDAFPWPAAADGTGPSLQLIDPSYDNRRPSHWFAAEGPSTPGTNKVLMDFEHPWKYNQSGNNLGVTWINPGYNDNAWPQGNGLLYLESAALPATKSTPLTGGPLTFYFRASMTLETVPSGEFLLNTILDDGAVIYINGTEALRLGMPTGVITSETTAQRTVGDASIEGPFIIPSRFFKQGANSIAVEVHQVNATSSDVVWGMRLQNQTLPTQSFSPGQPNSGTPGPMPLPPVWINEIFVDTASTPDTSWVEIYHAGESQFNLSGFHLSDDPAQLDKWAFPEGAILGPMGFGVVNLNQNPPPVGPGRIWNANLSLSSSRPHLILSYVQSEERVIVDAIRLENIPNAKSYGCYPDGNPIQRLVMLSSTFNSPNSIESSEIPVFISEWMALNNSTIQDPADGQYEDWFELVNTGSESIDLSGFHLSDDPANPRKFAIPTGVRIQAGQALLIFADSQPEQFAAGGFVHTNFRLGSTHGESIVFADPAGNILDLVNFPPMAADVSMGRTGNTPDSPIAQLPIPTPGTLNNPENPVPSPRIQVSKGLTPDSLTLTWASVPSVNYQLLASSEILNPSWTAVESITASSESTSLTVTPTAQIQFFILKVTP